MCCNRLSLKYSHFSPWRNQWAEGCLWYWPRTLGERTDVGKANCFHHTQIICLRLFVPVMHWTLHWTLELPQRHSHLWMTVKTNAPSEGQGSDGRKLFCHLANVPFLILVMTFETFCLTTFKKGICVWLLLENIIFMITFNDNVILHYMSALYPFKLSLIVDNFESFQYFDTINHIAMIKPLHISSNILR